MWERAESVPDNDELERPVAEQEGTTLGNNSFLSRPGLASLC